jgi:predicted nuclease of predicted toxin-antitoxin system
MKILIDMNLSPDWVQVLESAGHEAVHWSVVGNHDAPDLELFQWAIMRGYTVFTHDLDFGAILAATETRAPSVVQIRTQNLHPDYMGQFVLDILQQFEEEIKNGALISADRRRSRARILPLIRR